jgi:hypothetical protein
VDSVNLAVTVGETLAPGQAVANTSVDCSCGGF